MFQDLEFDLKQCAGEIYNFVKNAPKILLLFGSEHCCFDSSAEMPPICVCNFSIQLLWKQAKTAANLDIW